MDKKTYTFEDWKAGKITHDFEEGNIDGVISTTYGKLEYQVYSKGYIPKREYLKIREEQKKTFFKAVNITLECLKKDFKKKLENSPVPEKLLELKVKELKDEIDKAKNHHLKKALTNEFILDGIEYPVYAFVQHLEFLKERDQDYLNVIHISNPSKIPDDREHERGIKYWAEALGSIKDSYESEGDFSKAMISGIQNYVSNPVYDLTVILKFLEEIKQIKDSKFGATGRVQSSKLPNPDVIAENFLRQSKNTNTPYSLEEYSYVMKFARDNKGVGSVSQLIRDLKELPECPQTIKPKNKAKGSIRNWIKYYDKNAGIERT